MRVREIMEALAPFQDYDLTVEGGYGFSGHDCMISLLKDDIVLAQGFDFEELIERLNDKAE